MWFGHGGVWSSGAYGQERWLLLIFWRAWDVFWLELGKQGMMWSLTGQCHWEEVYWVGLPMVQAQQSKVLPLLALKTWEEREAWHLVLHLLFEISEDLQQLQISRQDSNLIVNKWLSSGRLCLLPIPSRSLGTKPEPSSAGPATHLPVHLPIYLANWLPGLSKSLKLFHFQLALAAWA